MLTREQCIREIRRNLEAAEEINLRNAVRSLADYARIALSELGAVTPGYELVENLSIMTRFGLLAPRIPELEALQGTFGKIEKFRYTVDHGESVPIPKDALQGLLSQIEAFDDLLDSELLIKAPLAVRYRCEIKWDGQGNDCNDPVEGEKLLDSALVWVDNAKKVANGRVEECEMPGQGKALLLKLKEGEVMFSLPTIPPRTPISSGIMIESQSSAAIDRILAGKEQWHWDMWWMIPQRIDLVKVAERVKHMTGMTPRSSGIDNGKLTSASYRISSDEELHLEVGVSLSKEEELNVHVGCYGSLNKGIAAAQDVLSPSLFLAVLYGELAVAELRHKIKTATGHFA